ncbi:uncharacterized protein [Apostichopus japonicus]|uniref:uncharacterized protein n=1 Tax=Stichopus japonicus TaxID=307972 RepID=UPI003AB6CEC1
MKLLSEPWYCKGAAGRPVTGYLEEHLRYVRKKKIAMVKDSPGASSPPTPLTKVSTPPKLREADLENKEELVMMTEWLKCNMEPREKVLDFHEANCSLQSTADQRPLN